MVEISGTSGRVREIGMRATTLQTFDGADVVAPNGTLLFAPARRTPTGQTSYPRWTKSDSA